MTGSRASREAISQNTLARFGAERLTAMCEGAGVSSMSASVRDFFSRMTLPWGDRPIGYHPGFRSNVADDGAPYEFSVALSDGPPEVQFYIEALGQPPSLASNMSAGRSLLTALAKEGGAPLDRLRQIEDLFFPETPSGAFTVWIGASFADARSPKLKVYLNPQVRGSAQAVALIDEAMTRLGFAREWSRVRCSLTASRNRKDELGIVSLDLSEGQAARIKVYVRHHGANSDDIHAFANAASPMRNDDLRRFYTTLANEAGPFLKKPPISEVAFARAGSSSLTDVTLEFPIGSYVANDEVALHRIIACMKEFGVPHQRYERAVRALATRPLELRTGIHAHVTLRHLHERPRIAVYFASEAYSPAE